MALRRLYGLVAAVCAIAAAAAAQQGKVIELRSADTLKGREINGEAVRELIGHVHFTQPAAGGETVKVWCDRALRYMVQNKIELFGHVKVVRDSVTIRAPEGVYFADRKLMIGRNGVRLERGATVLTAVNGEYYSEEKRSHFTGNVVLVDTSSIVTCSELNYFEDETRSVATDSVHVFEFTNGLDMYGDSLIHIERIKYSQMLKHPRLVKIDTASNGRIDTMVVISREMQSIQDTTERFIATDSVRMVRSDMASRCGKAFYFPKKDFIRLDIHPVIWSGENQVTGDSMTIRLENKQLRSLWVKHHAMAISRADSVRTDRFNQLTGRELTMYFRANKLEQVDVQKNATSLYYLYDNTTPNGVDKSSGDRIFIDFQNGEIDRIKIVGGVQGQYFPEKMIAKRESNYNLDGFRWLDNAPKRRGLFIIDK